MAKVAEQSHYIYCEVRNEKMVSPKDGKHTVRLATFLKPRVESVNQVVDIPNTPLLSEIFPHELQQWPSKVDFKGWTIPQKNWDAWIDRLAKKYDDVWKRAGVYDAIMSSRFKNRCNQGHQDIVLGLCEFWCPETNTFVFPWGEATITLEDIMILGGFPVLGKSVRLPAEGNNIVEEMNKKRLEMSRGKSRKATHGGWMKHFMEKDSQHEHVAFLSLWLSRYVFPSRSEMTIGKHVFPIAAQLSRGKRIALAQPVLASLYQNLSSLKNEAAATVEVISILGPRIKKKISVLGPFQLVYLWALERFPPLGSTPLKSLQPDQPRAGRWHNVNSSNNLPVVKSVFKVAENFRWHPYSAELENWRHPFYYKEETDQFVSDLKNSDQKLQSYVKCLQASKLIGIDFTEKYSPQRVAMQFGMDQDLPGDVSGLKFNWDKYNVRFFVPPGSFVPSVSLRYFNWWNKFKSDRAKAIKDHLVQKDISKKTRTIPSVQAKANKKKYHRLVASRTLKKPGKLSSKRRFSTVPEPSRKSQIIRDWSDDFDVPVTSGWRAKAANRTIIRPTDTLPSVPTTKTNEVPQDSSDIDHIPLAKRLKRSDGLAEKRKTTSHKAFQCNQSQNVVSSQSKDTPSFYGAAKRRKDVDFAKKIKRGAEERRKTAKESVKSVVKEGKKGTRDSQYLALERRVHNLEEQIRG